MAAQRNFSCRRVQATDVELGPEAVLSSPMEQDVEAEKQRVAHGNGAFFAAALALPPPPLTTPSDGDVVRIVNLKKAFEQDGKRKQAVNGISLGIHPGECFGLLGPNGAGSTSYSIEEWQPLTRGFRDDRAEHSLRSATS